jgi:uncharacterized membrane protein
VDSGKEIVMTTLSQGVTSAQGHTFGPSSQESQESQGMEQQNTSEQHQINVGQQERMASIVGGGLLTLLGLRRRSTFGALVAVVGGSLVYRGVTGHCPMYAAMGKSTAVGEGEPTAEPHDFFERGVHVEQSVTVNKPAAELYAFWHNFENLPRFMNHLESVKVLDDRRSHWVAKAPAGFHAEWDAEIINDEANRVIAWRSTGNADVANTGSVRFIERGGGQGTEVKVTIEYLPPAGGVGWSIAKLFGEEPQQQVTDDLNRFKQIMES